VRSHGSISRVSVLTLGSRILSRFSSSFVLSTHSASPRSGSGDSAQPIRKCAVSIQSSGSSPSKAMTSAVLWPWPNGNGPNDAYPAFAIAAGAASV
jgi:hypothetical protein